MLFGFNLLSGEVDGNLVGNKGVCLDCLVGYFCLNGIILLEFCGKGKYINLG